MIHPPIPPAFLLNILSPFAIGFVALYLGSVGFSRGGIPWTKDRNITGKPARVIGALCPAVGIGFIAIGVWFLMKLSR